MTAGPISTVGIILPAAKAQPPTCGNCAFGKSVPSNLQLVECNGLPPTPAVVGMQNTIGGPQLQVELLTTNLPRARPGCALWRLGVAVGETVN